MSESEKPIVLFDLSEACLSLSLLVNCASEWIPEEEHRAFADAIRPHLQAAAAAIAEHVKRNHVLLDLCRVRGTLEAVQLELADLQHHLTGRTAIGPGNPLRSGRVSTWRPPEDEPHISS